ncbi:DUF6318 family protein [Zafaria sp. J156]|uniref:DUF6318 family protein n=1 Tax=Zafaria sp. J156 TaxID=3116490 RepID=UPI002E7947A9|nr:DUF6318 family protein [Zafaria sp. J156]MEE1619825.1 DUF6318 family protein [Zafaria sp. J156]
MEPPFSTTLRPALATAALLALALTACSPSTGESPTSGAEDTTASTTSAPPTSASPTEPVPATSTSPAKNLPKPVMPPEAKEFSKEGYEAFVEYWFEAQNYGLATGDPEPFSAVSDERCGLCAQRLQAIETYNADGGWVVGGEVYAENFVTQLVPDDQEMYQGLFILRQEAIAAFDEEGNLKDGTKKDAVKTPFNSFAFFDEASGWKMAVVASDETLEKMTTNDG